MTPLIEALTDFLEDNCWPYVRLEDTTAVVFRFEGEQGEWFCEAKTLEKRGQVVCYSLYPSTVEGEQLGAISELLTMINDGLIMGNFELSYLNGEIRFKTSLDVEGEILTPQLIKHLIFDNIFTMDRYFSVIDAVLEKGISPSQALAEGE